MVLNFSLDGLRASPVAHRGLFNRFSGIPENSMAAFEAAISHGYSIELDVQILKDGELVVFHDDNLNRMTGVDASLSMLDSGRALSLPLWDTTETIPRLMDVLKAVEGRVPLMIEIKNSGVVGRMEAGILELLSDYDGVASVHSFNPASIGWFAVNAPEVSRGLVFSRFSKRRVEHGIKVASPQFMIFNIRHLSPGEIEPYRRAGMPIFVYTTKTPEEHSKAMEFCDNVIFEGYLPDIDRQKST